MNPDKPRVPIADGLDAFIVAVGKVFCWANVLLILVIISQVVMRYGFGVPVPGPQYFL